MHLNINDLYAFHSLGSVAVGIRRPRTIVSMVIIMVYSYTGTTTNVLAPAAPMQWPLYWVHHTR